MNDLSFYEKVYRVVRRIPRGCVATYGQIAALCGSPRAARVVGSAMRLCPHADVPCHRVVNRSGGLARDFGLSGSEEQRLLLMAEDVVIGADGCVDLARYLWRPAPFKSEENMI